MMLGLFFAFIGCTQPTAPEDLEPAVDEPAPTDFDEENLEKVFITDDSKKQWDITHAVAKYGFKAEKFEFGFGPDAIKPVLNPKMWCKDDPDYPKADDESLVIGTTISDTARAYPIYIMWVHEVANDKFGDTHVAVCYCYLADLTAVYDRAIDDKILTLHSSSWVYDNTFVLYDKETESLWYPLQGTTGLTCISGEYAKRTLPELPATRTRWMDWKRDNHDTKFLNTDGLGNIN
jgi:hypothetical protein